jgi:hypothetical protein
MVANGKAEGRAATDPVDRDNANAKRDGDRANFWNAKTNGGEREMNREMNRERTSLGSSLSGSECCWSRSVEPNCREKEKAFA